MSSTQAFIDEAAKIYKVLSNSTRLNILYYLRHYNGEADVKAECRLYENIVDEEKGKLNADGTLNLNPNSLVVLKECYVEPALAEAGVYDSFQFVRNGFFCADCKDSLPGAPVFNRIVSLKSSFKLPK